MANLPTGNGCTPTNRFFIITFLYLCSVMRRIITIILLSFFGFTAANAQMPGMGGMKAGGAPPKMGKIYGKVIDSKTGKPLDMASVALLQVKDGKEVLVKGATTEANGEFSLEELPMFGQFQLAISSLGYKPYKEPVAFDMQALMKAGASM